jgi:transposase
MSMNPSGLEPIPDETRALMQRLSPKGTMVSQLRDALGPIYSDEQFAHLFPKRGRAAEAPWRLALVTVLQAIEGPTSRQAAEYVRTRIDWLYALALPLDDPGFDYSILADFRQRLLTHEAQDLLLAPILQLCRERGWLKAGGKHRTDATAVLAQVRSLNSLESVGESMRAALNARAEQEPEWLVERVNPEWFDRYVHRFELARFPKAESQRARLRAQVGSDVQQLLSLLREAHAPTHLVSLPEVVILRQVFAQHYQVSGHQVHWRDGPAVHNDERIVSPYDPEARSARKRDTVWLGYKVHLTETCDQQVDQPHLIVQVETTAATIQDAQMLEPIAEQVRAQGLAPDEHFVDQGYTSGKQLVQQAALGTQIIGPVPADASWQAREHSGYAVQDFQLEWQQRTARCPQGFQSLTWVKRWDEHHEPMEVIRFPVQVCRACPVREQCTRGATGRELKLHEQPVHHALVPRRAEQGTPAFLHRYTRRAGVEGTIAQAVRVSRLRRTPYVGLPKTHLHHVAIAAGLNLKRIAAHLSASSLGKHSRPARPKSPFARLQPQRVA